MSHQVNGEERTFTERNEAMMRHMTEEVWSDHDFAKFQELVAIDYFDHTAVPEHWHGAVGERHVMNWLFSVFPDLRFDIEDAVVDEDTVAVRGTYSGTHEGELWGIPPTEESFAIQQSHEFRLVNGKLTENWAIRDDLGLMRQLGVMSVQE